MRGVALQSRRLCLSASDTRDPTSCESLLEINLAAPRTAVSDVSRASSEADLADSYVEAEPLSAS